MSLLDHLQPLLKSSTASVESLPWHLQSKMDTLRTHLVLLGSSAPIQLTTSPPFSCCSSECSLAPLSLCETNVKQKEKHRLKQHPKPQHSWDSYSQLLPYLRALPSPPLEADASICSLRPATTPLKYKQDFYCTLCSSVTAVTTAPLNYLLYLFITHLAKSSSGRQVPCRTLCFSFNK